MKMFQIQKFGGPEDGADVLGGSVSEENVYIKTYGTLANEDDKLPANLEVGESTRMRYALSGQSSTVYRIVRIS